MCVFMVISIKEYGKQQHQKTQNWKKINPHACMVKQAPVGTW